MASDFQTSGAGVHLGSPLSSLPQVFPLFLGREVEVIKIKRLLDEKHLVGLFGTGGVGKTRLALQVGGELREQFEDGVFFVPLNSIVPPESIVDIIAKKLGIKINPLFDALEQFLVELSSKNILLILDGLEDGFDPPLFLSQLIEHIPSLRVIITSRESLHIENEAVVEIHGLATPDRDSPDANHIPRFNFFYSMPASSPTLSLMSFQSAISAVWWMECPLPLNSLRHGPLRYPVSRSPIKLSTVCLFTRLIKYPANTKA